MDVEAGSQAGSLFSRLYPWLLCVLSFTVQFLGLGFYKGFASVFVALQTEFKDGDTKTGRYCNSCYLSSLTQLIIHLLLTIVEQSSSLTTFLTEEGCKSYPQNLCKALVKRSLLLTIQRSTFVC